MWSKHPWCHIAAAMTAAIVICAARTVAQPAVAYGFARQVRELSEPGGSFDTDNLISNERSYLHVIPALKRATPSGGGAYVGVGPDQNFSYIAAARPNIAFIIDVRRDNLLLQLLCKALFSLSRTRVEYLAQLCGRPVPVGLEAWKTKSVKEVTG